MNLNTLSLVGKANQMTKKLSPPPPKKNTHTSVPGYLSFMRSNNTHKPKKPVGYLNANSLQMHHACCIIAYLLQKAAGSCNVLPNLKVQK